MTVTDTTLSSGSVAVHHGASGTNTVNVADTAASTGKTLYYFAGTGPDTFTGGFENDTVYVSAAAVGGDTLTGGSGSNALVLTTEGTVNLAGVHNFQNIYLDSSNNTVTVTDTTGPAPVSWTGEDLGLCCLIGLHFILLFPTIL